MAFTTGLCENVQQGLNAVAGSNAPSLKRDKVGYLMALLSPENTDGVEKIQVDLGNDKFRKVRLIYNQRGLESEVTTTCDTDCATGDEAEPLEEIVEVDNCIQKKRVFDEEEIRKICEGQTDWITRVINADMNAIMVKLNKEALTIHESNHGNFIDGTSTSHGITLFNDIATSGQTAKLTALAKVEDDMENAGFSGSPLIIGSGDLSMFAKSVGMDPASFFACGREGDCANMGTYYKDRFLDGIIDVATPQSFLALAAGQVQFLTWNKYSSANAKEADAFSHGSIVDPLSGLRFDLKTHYDDCADKWFYKIQLNWTTHFLPSDSFAATDDNFGINGSFLYHSLVNFTA